jgi:Domain of unknown function (DUF4124)
MRWFAVLLLLAPTLTHAEDVWRWKDAKGTICYSNRAAVAPPDADVVKTGIVIEASRLPGAEPDLVMEGGTVIDAHEQRHLIRSRVRRPHRIYTEERLRFGCYAGNILYAGGWAHPDDINAMGNCLPYLLGPEAWLNAARAELALREHGLDWRQLVPMYLAEGKPGYSSRLTSVNQDD